MITIHDEPTDNGVEVYMMVMGERISLKTFEGEPEAVIGRVIIFKEGAEEMIAGMMEAQQRIAKNIVPLAQEAARMAGVDESVIAQGGIAVSPFAAPQIVTGYPYDDDELEAIDNYLDREP